MGVEGLQAYVEQVCADSVCSTVSIRDLAERHLSLSSTEQRPVLLVDGAQVILKLHRDSLDWVYGGQCSEFVVELRRFVRRFDAVGVRLVFFFDDLVRPGKRPQWNFARMSRMKVVEDVFKYLKATGRQPPDNNEYFVCPSSISEFLPFALKICCDVEVRSTIKEANVEIAQYAIKEDSVFAILTQDSDFLVLDTKPYLSMRHLDQEDLTTVMYDRQRLASELFLTVEQLPLMSCLIGNDFIPSELVKPFQRKTVWSTGRRGHSECAVKTMAPTIADVINDERWKGDPRDEQELHRISVKVFGDTRNLDLLRESMRFYSMTYEEHPSSSCWSLAIDRHVRCENFPAIYSLLSTGEINHAEVLEDYSDKSLPPVNIAYRPIMQRAYSLLYQDRNQGLLVREWCAIPRKDLFEPDLVPPISIEISQGDSHHHHYPSLEDLWCDDDSPNVQDTRLRCFFACLGGSLKEEYLNTVPPRYAIFSCVLNHLLAYGYDKRPLLATWEVSAFIAQAIHPQDHELRRKKSSEVLEQYRIDTRAVQLASLFMRGVNVLGIVLGICGYPMPLIRCMPWNFFDGKFFHSMYLRAKNGASVEELCDYEENLIKEFYRLLCVVTFGTSLADARLFRNTA